MKWYNIKEHNEQVTFIQALIKGLGENQGLFFPTKLPNFSVSEITDLLKLNFIERSVYILSAYIGSELLKIDIFNCVKYAFNFPVPLVYLSDNIAILELFHGPTLAFKDFGSRLMARLLIIAKQKHNKPMVILTATSGDTGAAVARAFYGLDNIYVVILYPKNKISVLQEKLFCTLGKNIFTISVNGDFDTCQSLVKQAFNDNTLQKILNLNSANSINISRLLAQICYYFEAVAQLFYKTDKELVFSVPSGNFGNLTAGLLAKSLGLPIKKFIAATNCNNTVPRYIQYGVWKPMPTVSTISNAMDVSCPSNWVRIEELFRRDNKSIKELGYASVSDIYTKKTIQEVADDLEYIMEPHTAVAYRALYDQLKSNQFGVCLGTAHPAKFKELIECFLDQRLEILLPDNLKTCVELPILSYQISACFPLLRNLILKLILK